MPPSVPAGKKDWSPPLVFAEYQLLWLLGRGGMGEVYLGHDKLLDRPVALKFISTVAPDDKMKEQYLTEARAAARLQHPNVVTVHRVGEIDGRLYIVSEYVRGQTLEHVQKPLPWQQALELAVGLSRGLAEAHRRGVLHRDIKPGNAILADNGEIKLLDFGLAKCVERSGPLTVPIGPVEINEETIAPTIDITDAAAVARVVEQAQEAHAKAEAQSRHPDRHLRTKEAHLRTQDALSLTRQMAKELLPPSRAMLLAPQKPPPPSDSGKSSGAQRRLAVTSSIKGTPMYMAPEVLLGLAATRRSDVYSMGALLFELCAGVPPHYDVPLDQLQAVVPKRDATPLNHIAPSVDPRFAALIDRCLRRNAAERFASGEQLLEALEKLLPTAGETVPEGNPYRGLWPFEDDHRALFFGRRGEIGTLLERLRNESCVLITADSGIGKTSLCRAGLLPLVRDGLLDSNRQWRIAAVTLGRQPLRVFVSALAQALEATESHLQERIAADPSSLASELTAHLPKNTGLLVLVDQLEELVNPTHAEDAKILAQALGSLLVRTPQLRLLMAVRSDYIARVGALPGFGETVTGCLYVLRSLGPERLREVVVGPAHAKGVKIDSSTLINTLVDSTMHCEGGLPLLQLALAELWEAREGNSITPTALDAIGGVSGALARHADHVIGSMLADRRVIARRLMCGLVSPTGTPISCPEAELLGFDTNAGVVLEALVRSRLIFMRSTADGPAYEIAHTSLISGWSTLQRWLAEPRAASVNRSSDGRSSGEAAALPFVPFYRRPRVMALLGAMTLALLVYAGIEVRSGILQRRQVTAHGQQGQRELAVARNLQSELLSLQQQAFAAFDAEHLEDSERLLLRAHTAAVAAERAYGRASHQLEAALNLDGGRADLRDTLADILYERALAAEADHQEGPLEDLLQRLMLYDTTGQRRQRWARPGRLSLTSSPSSASVQVVRYSSDGQKHWTVMTTWSLGSTPLQQVELEPGPYVFIVSMPGFMPIRYPLYVRRAADIEQNLNLQKLKSSP